MRIYLMLALLVIVAAFFSRPAEALDVYDTATLQQAQRTYSDKIRAVWEEDLLGHLTVDERTAAGNVRLSLPLVGVHRSPFDYYSDPDTREITIPIMAVKFFDDLAIAAAWFTRQGCAISPVSDYTGMLRYQGSPKSAGDHFPPPLQALGIPRNILTDAYVADVSGKMLKTAIYFLMAHELAHVIYRHKRYDEIRWEEAQAQEIDADDFALKIMRRISVAPLGIVLWFTVVSRFEPAPGDYPGVKKNETWAQILQKDEAWRKTLTHPLTSQRLLSLSAGIRSSADEFSQGQRDQAAWRPRILEAAHDIEAIGNTLNDPKIRELQKYRSEIIKMSDLSKTCSLTH